MKYSFYNDYPEGAHPKVWKAMQESNFAQVSGYGTDVFTKEAADLIRKAIQSDAADVHFLSAGTQANFIMLSSMLKSYEAVIAADSGHINVHEAGAVEATGHKIILVKNEQGKVTPQAVEAVCKAHGGDEHMVSPRVVYVSQTTELGTIYSKAELQALSETCKKLSLLFYLDGARLGSALTASTADATLVEISSLVDAFYIGGTKNGALFGEALVINNPELQKDFRYHLKQRGALLAKGRAISLQFKALFTGGLYEELARHTNSMATILAEGIKEAGYGFMTPPVSNQIFPVLPNELIATLQKEYGFYVWAAGEKESSIRLVTSWATSEEAAREFVACLKKETPLSL